jgi:hypothetical protein
MDLSVALAPWPEGPATGKGAMFVATIRTEYRVVPASPILRFACVSDLDEYRDLLQDPTCTLVHYFQPVAELELHGAFEAAFELVEVAIDGRPRPTRRTARAGTQVHTVSVGTGADRMVAISYTYRVLLQQHGHLLHLDFPRPTKGLRAQLAYGGCGIRRVKVVDYIASSRQPGLSQLPPVGADTKHRAALRRLDAAQGRRGLHLGARAGDGNPTTVPQPARAPDAPC